MVAISALFSGLLFGFGLIIAGMSNPAKILAFLDITGQWDPSLLVTMAVAMLISAVAFWIAKQRKSSLLHCDIQIPTKTVIDKKLVLGSLLFGIGWGLAGICPGPAVLLTGAGQWQGIIFTFAMVLGMWIFQRVHQPK
ncbi:DUF6691 family protein [Moellerella wisconsensis]|uniref:DUF6691 family protein n=1 Tax=Moellerella wisconsensis TaxID=158849 RepID=UPI0006417939|nr:DUF6691 family protein [Moellerella wisconsensis]KLN96571.1 membrane protein [Moellerella wisconsensis]UNH41642.1 YeeE/YedE family protein [Moellerella wisconsensis]